MADLDPRGKRLQGLLAGRFEILQFLGKGGFAAVYKVKNETLGRLEALKILLEDHTGEEDFGIRFLHEARVAASLEHPNIVKIYEFGEVEGLCWYSMQYIPGGTLSSDLKNKGRLTEDAAVRISSAVLAALEYCHRHGIVHRDVKPDNVILDESRHPYLMDFGIAKSGESVVKTESGYILGSPAYLSPEQLRGKPLDGRSDVYSLGVMLYLLLAGELPFLGDDKVAVLMKRLQEDAPPLSKARPSISPALEEIVAKSLTRERDSRFATAAAMREALEAFLRMPPDARRRRMGNTLHGETLVLGGEGSKTAVTEAMDEKEDSTSFVSQMVPLSGGSSAPSSITAPSGLRAAPGAPEPRASTPPKAAEPVPRTDPSRILPTAAAPPKSRALLFALPVVALIVLAGTVLVLRGRSAEPPPVVAQELPTPAPVAPQPSAIPEPTAIPAEAPTEAPVVPAPQPTREPVVIRTRPVAPPVEPRPIRQAVTQPAVDDSAAPAPPDDLKALANGRSVGISVTVGEDGSIKSLRVISKVCGPCDKWAEETVRTYFKFRPAEDQDHKPVEAKVAFSISL